MHAQKSQQHPKEKSRELQRKLYLAAKRNRNRRFHALYDRIYRPDVLWRAWEEVKANKGSSGVDGQAIEDIERQGVKDFLNQLAAELRKGIYRPKPVKRVYIPKPDGRQRPLGIPCVRDRVVQQAAKIIIEPLFEANFQDCSYGFRPKRSAKQAVGDLKEALVRGWYVVDADIQGFFDSLDHDLLMKLVQRRISDRRVLKLVRQWLKTGVLEGGRRKVTNKGTPQGGVISPLLANIYLHVMDMYWIQTYSHLGKLIRYCDDFVVVCRYRHEAEQALQAIQQILKRLKLTLHPDKTRIVRMPQDGFDFLGFHFLKFRSRISGKLVPYAWPSKKAMNKIRDRIRQLTASCWLRAKPEEIVSLLNPVIRGWRNYFSGYNASKQFQHLDFYVQFRLMKMYWRRHHGRSKGTKAKCLRWLKLFPVEHFFSSIR